MTDIKLLKDLAFGKKGEVVSLPHAKADYLIKFGSAEKFIKPKEKEKSDDKPRVARKSKK